jgi:hypothetical protein
MSSPWITKATKYFSGGGTGEWVAISTSFLLNALQFPY